jgi:hypothetical protein
MIAPRLARIAFALVSLAGTTAVAGAQNIPVVNGSFEANVLADGQFLSGINQTTGWVALNGAGTFNPTTGAFAVAAIPNGSQAGFANAGATLTQTFSQVLAANTTYTLSYYVGNRADMPFNGYLVSLLGGATTLASQGNLSPGEGQFLQGTFSFTTGASSPLFGQALGIQLAASANPDGNQVAFDVITLNGTTTVPEPATVSLLVAGMLLIGGVSARRKRVAP